MVSTIRVGPSVGGVVMITVGTLYGIHVVGTDVTGDCDGVAEGVVGRAGVGRDNVGGRVGASVLALASGESVGASVPSSGIVAGASTTTRTRRAPLRQSCPSGGGGSGGGG